MSATPFVTVGERCGADLITWNPHWRPLLEEIARRDNLPEPFKTTYDKDGTIGVWSGNTYEFTMAVPTYTVDLEAVPDNILAGTRELAAALYEDTLPESGLAMCTGMTDVLGSDVFFLWALLREQLNAAGTDDSVGLFVPCAWPGDEDGTFPLHVDLFIPQVLLNVYDRVPANGEGASLILDVATYREVLERHVSDEIVERLLSYISREQFTSEGYDDFYALMYNHHPYTDALKQALRDASLSVEFQPGEGYLVRETQWLHGRAYLAKENGVAQRLRRLTYDTHETHRARLQRTEVVPIVKA